MRTIRDPQMKFGEVDIAAIELDLKARDDIPPILRGLQYIYTTPALRASVFKVLEQVIPSRSGPDLSNEDRHRKADPVLGVPGWSSGRFWCLAYCAWVSTPITTASMSWLTITTPSGRCSGMVGGRTKRPTTGRRSRITCVFSHLRFSMRSISWLSKPDMGW